MSRDIKLRSIVSAFIYFPHHDYGYSAKICQILQAPFLPSFSTALTIPSNLGGCVTDYQYTTKTLRRLTCVPPRLNCVPPHFYCISPCFDYVSVSPFAYCIYLPRVYIDALELHSQSSCSVNSTHCKSLHDLTFDQE